MKTYHMCIDVRGALHNWNNRNMRDVFSHDDGRKMTVREAKNALMDEIAKGRKVIPCSPCDNFDYQRGCQGHDEPTGDRPRTPDGATEHAGGYREGAADAGKEGI